MKRKCFNCGKELKVNENSHIKKCSGLEYDICRYKQLLFDYSDFDISYENFKYMYNTLLYSLIDFKREIGLCYRQTLFLLEYYNIPKRDKKSTNEIRRSKYESTCIERYGVKHSTTKEVVDKIKSTCIERYGCDNIFKNKDFIKNSIDIKNKKYGKAGLGWIYENEDSKKKRVDKLHSDLKDWWLYMDDSEKNFRIEILKDSRFKWWSSLKDDERYSFLEKIKNRYDSSLELLISDILDINNIKYKRQYWVNKTSYDIKIGKILLEINGDFWHCNPIKYNESYIHPYIKKAASDIWLKDYNKKLNAEKYGYKVIYIWEDEIRKTKDLSKLVLSKLNID